MAAIIRVDPIIGMEVHVELATRSKMFSRALNPAYSGGGGGGGGGGDAAPNTLIDPVVLGLPGALPVINAAAVDLAIVVGLALGCSIAEETRWDRKSYIYPDLPKGYQISQFELPLCFDGFVELPRLRDDGRIDVAGPTRRIGIERAHLEEDAGKLLHETPAGFEGLGPVEGSIVDLNRAGTPLLEIVTQPDLRSADEAVLLARMLRDICRFVRAGDCTLQRGQMRFEPNINAVLTLDDGRAVRTPVVEVKNLNSYRALRGAIEYELAEQPRRWERDGRVAGLGTKTTRGWDDAKECTFEQRGKEDAHDYRYFPDPDLLPVTVSAEHVRDLRAQTPELPLSRMRRYVSTYGLDPRDAETLTSEREDCQFYEAVTEEAVTLGLERSGAGRQAANLMLQSGLRRAKERARGEDNEGAGGEGGTAGAGGSALVSALGITPAQAAQVLRLRHQGRIGSTGADELFGLLCAAPDDARAEDVASAHGLLTVRDEAAMAAWVQEAIESDPDSAAQVRAGNDKAIGRLLGAVMRLSGGAADAKEARRTLGEVLGQ